MKEWIRVQVENEGFPTGVIVRRVPDYERYAGPHSHDGMRVIGVGPNLGITMSMNGADLANANPNSTYADLCIKAARDEWG